jgi:hypothetical protein
MRKALFLAATVAATAMVVSAVPAVASASTAAKSATTSDVLTTGSVGGADVAVGNYLTANLKQNTSLVFAISIDGISVTLSCTAASIAFKTKANPAAPGTATLTVNKQKANIADCTVTASTSGLIDSATALTFTSPHRTTISDASGHPVAIAGPEASFTFSTIIGSVTCTYTTTTLTGTDVNKGSDIEFSNQPWSTLVTGSNSNCPTSGVTFSATYGPLKDQAVTGTPHVLVN